MNIRSRLTYSRLRPRGERIADIDQLMIDTAILLDIIHEPFALIGGQQFFLFQSQLLFLQYCEYTASVLIILLRPFKIVHSFSFRSTSSLPRRGFKTWLIHGFWGFTLTIALRLASSRNGFVTSIVHYIDGYFNRFSNICSNFFQKFTDSRFF